MKRRVYATVLTAVLAAGILAGCGSSSGGAATDAGNAASSGTGTETQEASAGADAQEITIGIRQDLFPTSYIDESGTPSGYDVEVARLVDEQLPEYTFKYDAVNQENLLLGLDTGKYAAAFAGFFWNEDRAQKYIFPKENICLSAVGIITTKEHSDLTGFQDVADQGLTVSPAAGTSGVYSTVQAWNEDNPDHAINMDVSEWRTDAEGYQWVLDGRYDVCFAESTRFAQIKQEIDKNDELIFIPCVVNKTYTLFSQGQQDFADKYDTILKQLKDDGTLSSLSQQYFGQDMFTMSDGAKGAPEE